MPIQSQAQARFEFAHPETFSKEKVVSNLHAQGGMNGLPERKGSKGAMREAISSRTKRGAKS